MQFLFQSTDPALQLSHSLSVFALPHVLLFVGECLPGA